MKFNKYMKEILLKQHHSKCIFELQKKMAFTTSIFKQSLIMKTFLTLFIVLKSNYKA